MLNDDRASEQAQAILELTLLEHRTRAKHPPSILYTGYCHNPDCEEDIASPKIFCNNVCADRLAYLQKIKGEVG